MFLETVVPALCGAAVSLAPRFAVGTVLSRTTVRSPIYYLTMFIGVFVFVLVRMIISWRSRKSSGYFGSGMTGRAGKVRDSFPSVGLEGLGLGIPLASAIGAVCPRCGTVAGQGAITCPSCGYEGPDFKDLASQAPASAQAPAAAPLLPVTAGVEVGASVKCPSCGTLLAAGISTCPFCNWHLHTHTAASTSPVAATTSPEATTIAPARIGMVLRDVMVGGSVAFLKDEWVKVEMESPDPQRPEYKYVCHSESLDKKFRLSDMDLSLQGPPGVR